MVYGNRQETKCGWSSEKAAKPQKPIRALTPLQTELVAMKYSLSSSLNEKNDTYAPSLITGNLTQLLIIETMRHNLNR